LIHFLFLIIFRMSHLTFFHDISSLSSLSFESIQSIISSPFLHLQNENQLFLVVNDLIQVGRTNLEFLKYISFGLINISSFLTLINSIQFHEISSFLFNIRKSTFSSVACFHLIGVFILSTFKQFYHLIIPQKLFSKWTRY
jgi:hypothetical protein